MAHKPFLVGFSAGGWETYSLAKNSCKELSENFSVWSLALVYLNWVQGRDGHQPGICSNFYLYREHAFRAKFGAQVQHAVFASIPESGVVRSASRPQDKPSAIN